jgi:hypothetical protein
VQQQRQQRQQRLQQQPCWCKQDFQLQQDHA